MIDQYEKEKICKRALDTYGLNWQLIKLAEECAELVQAICKAQIKSKMEPRLDDKYMENIYEEIADVEILIEQMNWVMGRAITRYKYEKLERLRDQLDAAELQPII